MKGYQFFNSFNICFFFCFVFKFTTSLTPQNNPSTNKLVNCKNRNQFKVETNFRNLFLKQKKV